MRFKGLGNIKEVNLEFENLLVFTGKNNTGKTYTSYILYGLLSVLSRDRISNSQKIFSFFDKQLLKSIVLKITENKGKTTIELDKNEIRNKTIQSIKDYLEKNIKNIAIDNFRANEKMFKDLEFEITNSDIESIVGDMFAYHQKNLNIQDIDIVINNIKEDENLKITFDASMMNELEDAEIFRQDFFFEFMDTSLSRDLIVIPEVTYFPAERNGINVFKNELNESRLKTYDTLMNTLQFTSLTNEKEKRKKRNEVFSANLDLLMDGNKSYYPKPISDYIKFLNNMKNISTHSNNETSEYVRSQILEGKYEIDDDDKSVYFRQKNGKNGYKKVKIPFHIVSSSIKSLFGLDYYLDFIAKPNSFLIIDEPELNLHPENQVKFSKVLELLVKSGVRVIISTHSDLLIRSLTNLALEEKLKGEDLLNSRTKLYNFEPKKGVKNLGSLIDIYDFPNFDNINWEVQDKYNSLLEQIEASEK